MPLRQEDEWLTAALETDPAMMVHLGGPLDPAEVPALHARRLAGIERGDTWYFTVRLIDGTAVGAVCLWHDENYPAGTSEAGWSVLTAYQGRGIATAAVRTLIGMARADGRWGDIHAWPAVDNVASNSLCRSLGFRHIGVDEFEFRGHRLRCNDWVLPAAG
ncbi:MAG TPA: GNAT family N-acetyltransferase [Candidatus Limnocylindria bacterium]|nr:GNAT family N-acetyltransferase [Candidatus Limnocylindria bacterium]